MIHMNKWEKKNEKTKATSSIYQFTSSVTYKHFGIHIGWEHINQSINNQESWNYMNISKKLWSDPSYNRDQFISLNSDNNFPWHLKSFDKLH